MARKLVRAIREGYRFDDITYQRLLVCARLSRNTKTGLLQKLIHYAYFEFVKTAPERVRLTEAAMKLEAEQKCQPPKVEVTNGTVWKSD